MVTYTKALTDKICERIAEGESLAAICRDDGMPNRSTFHAWKNEDRDGLSNRYTRAKEGSADSFVEQIVDVAQAVLRGEIDPNTARVAVDMLKWTAGKYKPKVYGDKLAIGGADDLPPVRTIDLSGISDVALAELMNAAQDAD